MAEKLHSKFSASGSEIWTKCEGAIQAIEKAPPQPPNPHSEKGTLAHAGLERLLSARIEYWKHSPKVRDFIPQTGLRCVRDAYEDVQEMFSKEEDAKELFQNVHHAFGVIWKDYLDHGGDEILSEQKCDFPLDFEALGIEGQGGTTDAAIVRLFDRLTIYDYKNGYGYVDVFNNTQLILYALGLAAKYDYNFTEVELVVIQPNSPNEEDETVRRSVMSIEELLGWIPYFESKIRASLKPGAQRKAGEHCTWCPAAVNCPELSTKALAEVQADFAPDTGELSLPDIAKIPVANLPQILDAAPKIEHWLKAVRAHAENVLCSGGKIPGYKLVAKQGRRKWVDVGTVMREAREKFGDLAFSEPELLSPAQLEKVTKDKAFVKDRCSNISSGLTLVHESDPRDAWDAGSDFDAIGGLENGQEKIEEKV